MLKASKYQTTMLLDETPAPAVVVSAKIPAKQLAKADRLAQMADGLDVEINKKRHCHSGARPTHKRLREQSAANEEADRLERMQIILRAVAELNRSGVLLPPLSSICNKVQARELVYLCEKQMNRQFPRYGEYKRSFHRDYATYEDIFAITTMAEFDGLRSWAESALERRADTELAKQRKWQMREKELAMGQISGYFPTPDGLAEYLVQNALILPGMSILEPSAGSGSIARQIRAAAPDHQLICVEQNHSLGDLLREQGFVTFIEDFMVSPSIPTRFDRVIMNPPFERGQDMAHVLEAFNYLKTGGRLVAIVSAGALTGSTKAHKQFQDWLAAAKAEIEDVDAGAFQQSLRPTGVSCNIISVWKGNLV